MKTCCYSAVVIPFVASILQSCESIYYATSHRDKNRVIIPRAEFWKTVKNKKVERPFVLVNAADEEFPICIYKNNDSYTASLLKCTHRGCELNVGGGIYSCPCHGSEFSTEGKVLEGPADQDLKTYKIETDNENIYIYLF